MQWFHECSLEWLKERQECLTATDIKELLPVTKTGRKRTVTDENYYKVLARKLVHLTKRDCISIGAAARGHILEPYAINMFNSVNKDKQMLCHWDDEVIDTVNHGYGYALGFSPDACDIPQYNKVDKIKVIGEVKCYAAEKHMALGHASKESLEERWQIATAMAVLDTIEKAYLILYNPSLAEQMYVFEYSREDLEEEIEIVCKIYDDWDTWCVNKATAQLDSTAYNGYPIDEERIIKAIIEEESLNPDGKKSVVL